MTEFMLTPSGQNRPGIVAVAGRNRWPKEYHQRLPHFSTLSRVAVEVHLP